MINKTRTDLACYPMVLVPVLGTDNVAINEERRTTIAVVLESGTDEESAIFSVGEAVCGPKDVFNKRLGRKIAVTRANHGPNIGAVSYKIEDFERMVKYEGIDEPMSDATAPISGAPIPYGIVNRLRLLIPR